MAGTTAETTYEALQELNQGMEEKLSADDPRLPSLQGPTGPQGIPGEPGPTGPQGPEGQQGPIGLTGAQGPSGTGEAGDQGPIGPAGPQGEVGPAGPQGDVGPAGSIGPQGDAGPQGIKGDAGAQGAKGDTGDPGTTSWNGITDKPASFTASAHTHSVNDLTASGTKDATTFLRGDNTWAAPPSGGNDSRIIVTKKTVAQAVTSTTAADVTGMGLSLLANSTYYVYFVIPIGAVTGTSPTLTLSFTGPSSPNLVQLRRRQMTSATAEAVSVITSFTSFAAGASVANTFHIIEGIVVNSGNVGVMQLRAAAGGTNPSVTIPVGASAYAIKTA